MTQTQAESRQADELEIFALRKKIDTHLRAGGETDEVSAYKTKSAKLATKDTDAVTGQGKDEKDDRSA